MLVIAWSNQFSVGVQEIDKQHQVLVELLQGLSIAFNAQDHGFDSRKVLNDLVQYASYHFATEERLMREINFAGLDSHVREHQDFVTKVLQLVAQVDQGQTPSLEDLLVFLRDWLVLHILHSDRDLGDALNLAEIR